MTNLRSGDSLSYSSSSSPCQRRSGSRGSDAFFQDIVDLWEPDTAAYPRRPRLARLSDLECQGAWLPLVTELPRGLLYSETHMQNTEIGWEKQLRVALAKGID